MTAPRQNLSARPAITAALMEETGLTEDLLRDVVHGFYDRVRADAELGPILPTGSTTGVRIWRAWWISGPRWR